MNAKQISGPIIGIGHSVGGQLALLAAPLLDAVVALAPVTDVARADREGLGEDAAQEFMGTRSSDSPRDYADASPIRQLPLNRPQLLVHGDIDARVPVAHTRAFQVAAREHGDDAQLIVVPGLGHLDAIDPAADHWPQVLHWLGTVTPLNGKAIAT
jgi:dipeptidyl aminopeptidase/acylaminoacyl peptidase